MEIKIENDVMTLHGAPPKSVVEMRWQNTLNGRNLIQTVEISEDGSAALPIPPHYGVHYAASIRYGQRIAQFIRNPDGTSLDLATPVEPAVTALFEALNPSSGEEV